MALNNVYAHIPDVVGFTRGLRSLVADDGWVSIEVQHLLTLVERTQFDTIYHEHFQYYTVLTAQRALDRVGERVVVLVEEHDDDDPTVAVGRAEHQGPDVDGVCLVRAGAVGVLPVVGSFVEGTLVDALGVDLVVETR